MSDRGVDMRSAYRIIAFLIALEVMIQAGALALGQFGFGKWIDEGGTLDKAAMESSESLFGEEVGFIIHGINGLMVIPILALVLLIISFFAKIPGGAKWAGFVLLAVVAQVLFAIFARSLPAVGFLHGVNALILFGLALMAAMRVNGHGAAAASRTSSERERV